MTGSMRSGLLAAMLAMLMASPAMAAWRKAESDNFIVYSEASDGDVREQTALLEDYFGFLRLLTGVDDPPPPNKLRVYLMRDRDDLKLVRDVPAGVKGFYTATPSGIAAFVDDRGSAWTGDDEILFHEIAHHFMAQYRPIAYPAWFVEGFAEYVMTAKFKGPSIELGQPSAVRVMTLRRLRWLPIERVLFERASGSSEERALFYAQSWLLTHYMMRDEARRGQFKAYVAALNGGTPPRDAFAAQFGDLKAFEKALAIYAARQMTYSRLTRTSVAAKPAVRVDTLPAAADDLLAMEAALYIGQRADYAAKLLPRVRAAAEKFAADPYAERVLAMAEVLHGDGAKGEALLDKLLSVAPNDADLLYLKGMRYLLAGRADQARRAELFKQARPWFVRAHKADPNHWRALARYGESLTTDSRFNSDNTMNIVLKAQELAPQVEELTMNAANLLILRGHYREAEALVRPLASHPHNEELALAAQALIERARTAAKSSSKPAGE